MGNEPKGIRGWLVLYLINFITITLLLASFVLTTIYENASFVVYLLPVFIVIINLNSLYQLFNKKKEARLANIISCIFIIILAVIAAIIGSDVPDDFFYNIIGMGILYIVWLFYWIKSKRVKNTFVN